MTARDIKSCVEGYSDMSDEAFARRFYSDRSRARAPGCPAPVPAGRVHRARSSTRSGPSSTSCRRLELSDDELAALQTSLFLLEGQFAYAEPLRLALQNLALGRPGSGEAPTATAVRVEVLDRDYSPETSGRLAKLDAAISKQRTVRFDYWAIGRDEVLAANAQPVRALLRQRGLVRGRQGSRAGRHPHLPRLPDPRRHHVRHAERAGLPLPGRLRSLRVPGPAALAGGRDRRRGAHRSRGGHRLVGRASLLGPRAARGRRLRHRVLGPAAPRLVGPPSGRARPPSRAAGARRGGGVLARPGRRASRGAAGRSRRGSVTPAGGRPGRAARRPGAARALRRPPGAARPPARELRRREACRDPGDASSTEGFQIPYDQLDEHLQLLNLVNFGGGCYAVYAALDGDEVRVEKELFGDAFRRAPRLTPLEARAIRLALEFVGPMIAAGAHTPARAGARQARGDVRPVRAARELGAADRRRGGAAHPHAVRRDRAATGSSRSST